MIRPHRFESLVKRLTGVSVRFKFMGIALGLVLALGSSAVLLLRHVTGATLSAEIEERGGAIARGVARRSVDFLVTEDPVALRELLADALQENRDVRYILVQDRHGNVLAHTFGHFLPPDLQPVNGEGPWRGRARTRKLASEEGNLLDVAVPIFEGDEGLIRVGMTEARMERMIDQATLRLLVLIAAACGLAVVSAYLPTAVLTRPLLELRDLAIRVGAGDFKVNTPVRSHDEIGQLATAFNDMAARLDSADAERSVLHQELRLGEQLQRSLVGKIMTAQEEERRRVSRELHDEAGQSLASLLMGLGMVESATSLEEARSTAAELRTVTHRVLGELRQIAWQLRPSLLDRLGLTAAVTRLAEEISGKAGIRVGCQFGGMDGRRLPPEVEITVYRIVQEALTNVVRHAGTDEAEVALVLAGASVHVSVRDAGKGFDVDAILRDSTARKRLGLFGMQERATLAGGRFWVESTPGNGTKVALVLPLEEAP